MRKFSSISKNKRITNITIGKFDSIHLAHRALIGALDKNGAVIIIKNKSVEIIPQREKKRLIKKPIFFIKFKKIRHLSGEKFLKYLQKKLPNLRKIIIGEDFRFGKNRANSATDIPKISPLKVQILPEMRINGTPVHSQNIRAFLAQGAVDSANQLLGRKYSIKGCVVSGQGIGAKSVFPTINVEVCDYVLPQSAVYATRTRIKGKIYDSISFIGKRVSADNNFAIESHILGDFELESHKILGKKIEIFFIQKIRDNAKFSDLNTLKKQIAIDIKKARAILAKNA